MVPGVTRILRWDGGFNVRDLGGIPTRDGGATQFGGLIRSGSLDRMTGAGWQDAQRHGVTTVIDLTGEYQGDQRPASIVTVNAPLEDTVADAEWWERWKPDGLWATPLYYRAFLESFPARTAAAIKAIADAAPGTVLFHCGRGRDRTGMIAALVLMLADVALDDVADDYELTNHPQAIVEFTALGHRDDAPILAEIMMRHGTTLRTAMIAAFDGLDARDYLRSAGLSDDDLDRVKRRLIPSSS
jgi:protein-tyrosine phosphatase